nr:uncharacterized protein LOC121503282 [Drosophila kikkawai]
MEILDGLTGVGIELNDELRTIVLLSSLPEQFEHFVVAMETRDQLPSFEVLTIKLKEESEKKGIADERVDNTKAFAATQKHSLQTKSYGQKKRKPIVCFKCGEQGHIKSQCRSEGDHRMVPRDVVNRQSSLLHACDVNNIDNST